MTLNSRTLTSTQSMIMQNKIKALAKDLEEHKYNAQDLLTKTIASSQLDAKEVIVQFQENPSLMDPLGDTILPLELVTPWLTFCKCVKKNETIPTAVLEELKKCPSHDPFLLADMQQFEEEISQQVSDKNLRNQLCEVREAFLKMKPNVNLPCEKAGVAGTYRVRLDQSPFDLDQLGPAPSAESIQTGVQETIQAILKPRSPSVPNIHQLYQPAKAQESKPSLETKDDETLLATLLLENDPRLQLDPDRNFMVNADKDLNLRLTNLVVSSLEESCKKNKSLGISKLGTDPFSSLEPPNISIADYLNRITTYLEASPCVLIIMLINMDKLIQYNESIDKKLWVHDFNVLRLIVVNYFLAIITWEDNAYTMEYIAKVFGITPDEIFTLMKHYMFPGIDNVMIGDSKEAYAAIKEYQEARTAVREANARLKAAQEQNDELELEMALESLDQAKKSAKVATEQEEKFEAALPQSTLKLLPFSPLSDAKDNPYPAYLKALSQREYLSFDSYINNAEVFGHMLRAKESVFDRKLLHAFIRKLGGIDFLKKIIYDFDQLKMILEKTPDQLIYSFLEYPGVIAHAKSFFNYVEDLAGILSLIKNSLWRVDALKLFDAEYVKDLLKDPMSQLEVLFTPAQLEAYEVSETTETSSPASSPSSPTPRFH